MLPPVHPPLHPDHQAVLRTASFVRLFIVAAIATGASLMVLFIIAMTQSGWTDGAR